MILKNGKQIYANKDIIGIDDENNLYEGYDGELFLNVYKNNDLTKKELIEIADLMIKRWETFKDFIRG